MENRNLDSVSIEELHEVVSVMGYFSEVKLDVSKVICMIHALKSLNCKTELGAKIRDDKIRVLQSILVAYLELRPESKED